MASSVVLVTGVGRHIGGQVAAQLVADERVAQVVGVDTVPDKLGLPSRRYQYIHVDIRSPIMGKIVVAAGVDAVVHTYVTGSSADGHSAKEPAAVGSMQLFAACAEAPALRKIVVRSTTAVYGSSPRNPAMFTERNEPAPELRGYGKNAADVEGYARGFARRHPAVELTIVRLANVISPHISTPLNRYLGAAIVPTVLGFDPRIQFVHATDCIAALAEAAVLSRPGVFNLAGSGVVTLAQVPRRAGKLTVPVPREVLQLCPPIAEYAFSAEQLHFLAYGRVVDTAKFREQFSYRLRFSTEAALEEYLAMGGATPHVGVSALSVLERWLGRAARKTTAET